MNHDKQQKEKILNEYKLDECILRIEIYNNSYGYVYCIDKNKKTLKKIPEDISVIGNNKNEYKKIEKLFFVIDWRQDYIVFENNKIILQKVESTII